MRKLFLVLLIYISAIPINSVSINAQGGVPVDDSANTALRDVIRGFEVAAEFILEYGDEIYEWTKKALQYVNQTIAAYTLYTQTKSNIEEVIQMINGIATIIAENPEFGITEQAVLNKIKVKTLDLAVQLFHAFFDGEKKYVRMNDGGTLETLHFVAKRIRIYRRMIRLYARELDRKVARKNKRSSEEQILETLFKYN